jgi:hypothetical protein
MPRRATLLLLAATACIGEPPLPQSLPEGDAQVFASTAQPVLDRRCAEPTCHARADRPLALFSPGRRRADPARTFLNESLTDAELAHNARAVAAFALEPLLAGEPLASCLVLRKPLARAAGGSGHVGGEIFAAVDDPDYQALAGFLATLRLPEE